MRSNNFIDYHCYTAWTTRCECTYIVKDFGDLRTHDGERAEHLLQKIFYILCVGIDGVGKLVQDVLQAFTI